MNNRTEPELPKYLKPSIKSVPRPSRVPPSMVITPEPGDDPLGEPLPPFAQQMPPAPQIEDVKASPRGVPPSSDLLDKARKLAEALMQSAQAQFNVAENNLQRVKQFAQLIQDQVAEEEARARSLDARLNAFGGALIEAHEKFHNEPK